MSRQRGRRPFDQPAGANVVWAPAPSLEDMNAQLSREAFERFFASDDDDDDDGSPANAEPPSTTTTSSSSSSNPSLFRAGGAGAAPAPARPVTVVEDIREQFRADPVAAVRDNAGYHIDPATLRALAPEVRAIADGHERQNVAADELWRNADFHFVKLVEGFTGKHALISRSMGNGDGVALVQPRALSDIAVRPLVTEQPPAGVRLPFTQYSAGAAVGERYAAEIERQRVLGNIDRLMEQPQVSGEIQMAPILVSAIQEALSRLYILSADKYARKTHRHFYPDPIVKSLLARLVAQVVLVGDLEKDGVYHQNAARRKRHADLARWVNDLDTNCVWHAVRRCFVAVDAEGRRQAEAAKRQRLQDAFDPSTWA
jgi:hypothetical protein